jgi:hypothetical protein
MFWKSEFTNLGPEAARRFLGPTIVDEQIRSAINMMIVFAGPRRKTVNQVEAEVRQIVERMLKELREKGPAFGEGGND